MLRDTTGKGATSSRWKDFLRRLFKDRWAMTSVIVLLLYFVTAIVFESYSVYCYSHQQTPAYAVEELDNRFAPPSSEHWFGTDYLGRDVFLRALAGTGTAIKVGVIASSIAAIIGVLLGAFAGYFGGKLDDFVVWLYSTFAAMPTLLFILAFALLVGKGFLSPELGGIVRWLGTNFNTDPGMLAVYLGIGLTGWVTLCRVVRAETFKLRNQGYVLAAKVAGASSLVIIFRHIIPNLSHLIIIYFTLRFADAIMTEVIVSYLGMGVQSVPSWGMMIADGQERLWRGVWWEVAGATVIMFFLVLALHVLGDKLRDLLDPRLRDNA